MRSERSPLPISDLRVAASLACRSRSLLVLDARRQHRQRLRLVLVLGAIVLAFDHDAGGQMGDAHGGVGLVDVLAAGAGGAERVDAELRRIDHDFVDLVRFRHHRDRAGAGVDAALRLGRRHALHAMAAGLELQLRVGARADDLGDDFLVAAHFAGTLGNHFDLPALALRIAAVHAEQVAGEQRRFVAAGAGADLEEDVALVVGVLRQQPPLQLGSPDRSSRSRPCRISASASSRISGSAAIVLRRLRCPRSRPAIGAVELDHRRDLGVLARQLAVVVQVRGHVLAGRAGD